MHKTGRVLRALLLGAGALAVAASLICSLLSLPAAQLAFFAAALAQQPGAVCRALNEQAAQTVRGSWQPPRSDGAATAETAQPTPAPTPVPGAGQPTPTPQPTPQSGEETTPSGTQPIVAETFRQGTGEGYVQLEAGSIKNATQNSDAEIREAARGGVPFAVELNSDEPQVLILHTHATECYQPWDGLYYDPTFAARTQDTAENMCAVGARMAEVLNAAGINTLHDETLHDSPSYTESYGRSAQTAAAYLAQYPSIKVVLDVHRDALERDEARVKPITQIDGQDTAQVMIISGCSNGGTVNLPHWRLNLQFAAAWETQMETMYPGLTRPVFCAYRYYNQDLSTGSLLIEIGGHANTLEEALRGGELAARALAALFGGDGSTALGGAEEDVHRPEQESGQAGTAAAPQPQDGAGQGAARTLPGAGGLA